LIGGGLQMEKKEFNEVVKVVKLLTSSIFARKLTHLAISCKQPGLFYYSNISWERVTHYKPDIADGLSKVKVINDAISNAFYLAFPKLKEMSVEFNIPAFSSALNKFLSTNKTECKFPELIVPEGTREVRFDIPSKIKHPLTKEDIILPYSVVGMVVPDDINDFYEEIVSDYNKFSDNVRKYEFRVSESISGEKISLEMMDVEIAGYWHHINLPVVDGLSMVSAEEYVAKRESIPLYALSLLVNDARRTAKAIIGFRDDWLDCQTIMPGSLWFLRGFNP
jgi:hypothetical protein